jgi:pyruvate kinase
MEKFMKSQDAFVLLESLIELRHKVHEEGNALYSRWAPQIKREQFKNSARNLAYYLALRTRDIREIQEDLMPLGLSSLGRLESRTLDTIDAVIASLSMITGLEVPAIHYPSRESFMLGRQQLARNADDFFGEPPKNRNTRIMVTMQADTCDDYKFVKTLMEKGMNVARINCAHDNEAIWTGIINNVRRAEKELHIGCKVMMDIAGPKARISWLYTSLANPKVTSGDWILLSRGETVQANPTYPIVIGCSLPEMLAYLNVGETVLLDDGIVEGRIEEINDDGILVKVKKVQRDNGVRLKAEKGINFPHSETELELLTDKDHADIRFATSVADILSFPFVKDANDIYCIQQELKDTVGEEKAEQFPVMAKIETAQGVKNLVDIIFAAAGKNPFAIMIARGDLAVEEGFLRLAELQEEILWISEAADIPVVWATQVLDNMVRTGIPTRAEVTDAAEGGASAECVMLNKGPYLFDAMIFLSEILEKMQQHQYKKSSRLRALSIAKEGLTFDSKEQPKSKRKSKTKK